VVWPKIFLRFFTGVLALIFLIWLLIQTGPVQNFIAGKVAAKTFKRPQYNSKDRQCKFSLFDKMDLNNTLILDQHKDTLLNAGSLKLRVTDWFFWQTTIELKYIGLEDALIKQQRTDSVWNYQFLIDHFSSPDKAKKQSKKIVLKIQKVDLKNVVYYKNDAWLGKKLFLRTGSLLVDADDVDISKNLILINSIDMDKTSFSMENFNGNKKPDTSTSIKQAGLFLNPSDLRVRITSINIKNGFFGSGVKGEIPVKKFV
jgi:hypothetical protein